MEKVHKHAAKSEKKNILNMFNSDYWWTASRQQDTAVVYRSELTVKSTVPLQPMC